MAERAVVIDANVIVALLYEGDSKHADAVSLLDSIDRSGRDAELLDVLVFEALSVLGRRAAERKTDPPDLARVVEHARSWIAGGLVRGVGAELLSQADAVLSTMTSSGGRLSANDALVVVLQRQGSIGAVATFDEYLAATPDFLRAK
jgi:predicted nucleic acid-binding protein